VKPVGEPDAANLHVRFDERGVETEQGEAREAPTTERVGQQLGSPKPPRHTSTLPNYAELAGKMRGRKPALLQVVAMCVED
jgi:hypothetical protein